MSYHGKPDKSPAWADRQGYIPETEADQADLVKLLLNLSKGERLVLRQRHHGMGEVSCRRAR